MVISRSDAKRRRREGDTLEDTLQGSPKRTKVHAQRKFAQGSSNLSSPALTPVKDKEKVKTNGSVLSPEEKVKTNGAVLSPELIPSKRPKTEDFLTFLCFRGTPILPPQLDFFNVATVPDNQDEEQGSSQGDCSSSRMATVMSAASHKPHRSASTEQALASNVVKRSDRLRRNAKKKPTTAVQAIRKKYQEQRLAKQRARTLSTLTGKVKNKDMIQTRSSTLSEETRSLTVRKLKTKKQIIKKSTGKILRTTTTKKLKTLKYMPLRRISARGRRKKRRDLRHHPIRRGGLRSGGQLPPGSEEGLKKERIERIQHVRPSLKEKKDKSESNVFASSVSDFSSDDDQPLVKRTRPLEQSVKQKLARKVIKRIVKSSRKIRSYMVTRSKQQTPASATITTTTTTTTTKVSTRPTRKTKEAAAIYMELLGKKLISPEAEADEDSLSIDSFPELPNSRRSEQRENEMKARLLKEKSLKMQENQMKKDVKKDVSAQKKDNILQKKGAQIQKDDLKRESLDKLKSDKISGSPAETEEGKKRVVRLKRSEEVKDRKSKETEKGDDSREKIGKMRESVKSEENTGRIMRSMEVDKQTVKGKVVKTKDVETKLVNSKSNTGKITEIKGRPVRQKGTGIKFEDTAALAPKLKETACPEEIKVRTTRLKENEVTKETILKGKVLSKAETLNKRVKRFKDVDKMEGLRSKSARSKESAETEEKHSNITKTGEMEGSDEPKLRVMKSKEANKSTSEQVSRSTERTDEGKGKVTKVREAEKSQENKEKKTTGKPDDGKGKVVKASDGSKPEDVKSKPKSDENIEESKEKSESKEGDKVIVLKGRTSKNKDMEKTESIKGKDTDKSELSEGKFAKLCEDAKVRITRTRDIDDSKVETSNVKQTDISSSDKVSLDSGGGKPPKIPKSHEDGKGKQKKAFKLRVSRKDMENTLSKKSKGSKGMRILRNKKTLAVKKKIVESEDDNWEDEVEEEDEHDAIKPPCPPRRSLRQGSHDRAQPRSNSTDSVTEEVCTSRNVSMRSSHSSLSPVGQKVHKTPKGNRDSSEDKFSDSDEEPLGKIALKNSTSSQKSGEMGEEKICVKEPGSDCKKPFSKGNCDGEDINLAVNLESKDAKKSPKSKKDSEKLSSLLLEEKESNSKLKPVKRVRESSVPNVSEENKSLDTTTTTTTTTTTGESDLLKKSKNLNSNSNTEEIQCSDPLIRKKSVIDREEVESCQNPQSPIGMVLEGTKVDKSEIIFPPEADDVSGRSSKRDLSASKNSKNISNAGKVNSDVLTTSQSIQLQGNKKSLSSEEEKEQTTELSAPTGNNFSDGPSSSSEELKAASKENLPEQKKISKLTLPSDKPCSPDKKESLNKLSSSVEPCSPDEKTSVKKLSSSPKVKKIIDKSSTVVKISNRKITMSPEGKKIVDKLSPSSEGKKSHKSLSCSPEGNKVVENALDLSVEKSANMSHSSPFEVKSACKPLLSSEGKDLSTGSVSGSEIKKVCEKPILSPKEKKFSKKISSPEIKLLVYESSVLNEGGKSDDLPLDCRKSDDISATSHEEQKSNNETSSPESKNLSDNLSLPSEGNQLLPSPDGKELSSKEYGLSIDKTPTDKLWPPPEMSKSSRKSSKSPNKTKSFDTVPCMSRDSESDRKTCSSLDGKNSADETSVVLEGNKSPNKKKSFDKFSCMPGDTASDRKTFSSPDCKNSADETSVVLVGSKLTTKLPDGKKPFEPPILHSEENGCVSQTSPSVDCSKSSNKSLLLSKESNKSSDTSESNNVLVIPLDGTIYGDKFPMAMQEIKPSNKSPPTSGMKLTSEIYLPLEDKISSSCGKKLNQSSPLMVRTQPPEECHSNVKSSPEKKKSADKISSFQEKSSSMLFLFPELKKSVDISPAVEKKSSKNFPEFFGDKKPPDKLPSPEENAPTSEFKQLSEDKLAGGSLILQFDGQKEISKSPSQGKNSAHRLYIPERKKSKMPSSQDKSVLPKENRSATRLFNLMEDRSGVISEEILARSKSLVGKGISDVEVSSSAEKIPLHNESLLTVGKSVLPESSSVSSEIMSLVKEPSSTEGNNLVAESTSTEEVHVVPGSSWGYIEKKRTPIIPSEKKKITQKVSLLNNLVLSSSDKDKESDKNSFVSHYKFPPSKGDLHSSEIKCRNLYENTSQDIPSSLALCVGKSPALGNKEKSNETLFTLQNSDSSFLKVREGNTSKSGWGYGVIPQRSKNVEGINLMTQEDTSSGHKLPVGKSVISLEAEGRKGYRSSSQRREGTVQKKSDSQRKSGMACPKETELELQRRLSMVCLKETDSDPSTENGDKGKTRERTGSEIVKEPSKGDAVQRSDSLLRKDSSEENEVSVKETNKVSYPGESEVERHKRLIQKAKEELEQRLNSRDVGDVFKIASSKTPKKHGTEKSVHSFGNTAKHNRFHDTAKRLNQGIQKVTRKETYTRLSSWTERSQRSAVPLNSGLQSDSRDVTIKKKVSEEPDSVTSENDSSTAVQEQEPENDSFTDTQEKESENRISNKTHTEKPIPVTTQENDVTDYSLPKRTAIESSDALDISNTQNSPGELKQHAHLGTIMNFYSSQETALQNINHVEAIEIQGNNLKNDGIQLQESHAQINPTSESYHIQTGNFVEIVEEPVIAIVCQDGRVDQRLYFSPYKESDLQERTEGIQSYVANVTDEVISYSQSNPTYVVGRERNLDAILEPSSNQRNISNVLLPKDLSTLGDSKKGRIEKWLSESCSGSLVHKKDCSMIDGSSCKCGISVSDEEMLMPELPGERLISDGIATSTYLEENSPQLAKVGCPLLLSEVTGEQAYQSEKISALCVDDFKRKLGSDAVDKDSNSQFTEPNLGSIPAAQTSSSVIADEVQKPSTLSFMLSSIAQKSISSAVSEISNSNILWQNMKDYPAKNVCISQQIQDMPVEYTSEVLISEKNNVPETPGNKEERCNDKNSYLEQTSVLPCLITQELVKEPTFNLEPSMVEELPEKSKESLASQHDAKKPPESSKGEVLNPKAGGKSVQLSDRSAEKKSIFQQRRSFLHKTKERKDITPSASAFSPENESSVYAFETEPESPPVSTPFRSRARDSRTSSTTTSKSEEDLVKLGDEEISSPAVVSLPPPVTVQIIQAEKPVMCVAVQSSPTCIQPQTSTTSTQSTTSPVPSCRTSTSIAVQVNLDSEAGLDSSPQSVVPPETVLPEPTYRSMECSTQTEVTEDDDDESEGHLFYIPLQQAPTPSQQLIQGVAVKLGTEGPTGPNQRVIMRAKLVTKAPNFSRASGSAQDGVLGMRRSVLGHQHQRPTSMLMMDQKSPYYNSIGMSSPSSSGTYPPVGTVQPTARPRPSTETASQSRSDATTGTCDGELKDLTLPEPEVRQSSTKVPKMVQKQGQSTKEKTVTETDLPGPSTSSAPSVTPVKSSSKSSKEKSSAVQTSPSATGKGSSGVKRNFTKGKGSKVFGGSYSPTNVTIFPRLEGNPQLVEAPTFHPSEREFQDPLEFIDRIRPVAEKFGLCRVVPPSNFKPECKVTDDMRFTAYNQYVHKMLHRWGPNVMEMMAIRKYLATQGIHFTNPPWVGGMEVDLPRLYQTVQSFGGLKEVIEKKRWQRVADGMKIPKSAQDRVTKLDDIYCKYLLPYDTLSPDERQKLFDEVETEWALRESRITSQLAGNIVETPEDDDISDENEECIVKGRNMPLNAFYRIARNTMSMWFRQPEPSASEVEQEFWRHVTTRTSHVCVHSGSIDSSGWGYGFPCSKNSPFARHPWNLKVLTNNSGSVLRSMGPIMGVTVPTLHVGMVFTTCCWYRDPHGLPWIEYLHTGASKIWYGIPDTYSAAFRTAMSKLVPRYCRNKTIWLPSDTAMVPPSLLVKHGVSLCHTVQEPGQFIVVFPRAFTSSICTGYLVSESVYFAQPSWLTTAEQVFKDIQNSCEPSMFSLERLLFSIASDSRSHVEVLRQVLPMILRIRQQELDYRKQLYNLGLKTSERLPLPEANVKRRKLRPALEEECDYECEMCRANLFVSLVTNSHEEGVYCLPHAIDLLTKKRHHLKYCKLIYTYDQAELNELIQKLQDRIEAKSHKKSQSKYSFTAQK